MSQPTFLIVDDDPMIRIVLRRILTQQNPHALVFSAADVAEARHKLAYTRPQTVITDYYLQDGTGLDVLAETFNCDPRPAVVVISVDTGRKDAAMAAGAMAFLSKPFTPADLLDVFQPNQQLVAA